LVGLAKGSKQRKYRPVETHMPPLAGPAVAYFSFHSTVSLSLSVPLHKQINKQTKRQPSKSIEGTGRLEWVVLINPTAKTQPYTA
jgi:hypothetical protein